MLGMLPCGCCKKLTNFDVASQISQYLCFIESCVLNASTLKKIQTLHDLRPRVLGSSVIEIRRLSSYLPHDRCQSVLVEMAIDSRTQFDNYHGHELKHNDNWVCA